MTDASERPPVARRAGTGRLPIHPVDSDAAADAIRIADREPPLPEGFEERPLPAA